jgi:hypothetical protein
MIAIGSGSRIPVSRRGVESKIRRRLAECGLRLVRPRRWDLIEQFGELCIAADDGFVEIPHLDVEEYARESGLLLPTERLAPRRSDSRRAPPRVPQAAPARRLRRKLEREGLVLRRRDGLRPGMAYGAWLPPRALRRLVAAAKGPARRASLTKARAAR